METVCLGFNYRMSEVQSAVVLGQLERIVELVDIRKKLQNILMKLYQIQK